MGVGGMVRRAPPRHARDRDKYTDLLSCKKLWTRGQEDKRTRGRTRVRAIFKGLADVRGLFRSKALHWICDGGADTLEADRQQRNDDGEQPGQGEHPPRGCDLVDKAPEPAVDCQPCK